MIARLSGYHNFVLATAAISLLLVGLVSCTGGGGDSVSNFTNSGSADTTILPGTVSVNAKTITLSSSTTANISNVSQDGSTITFSVSNEELASLEVGSIIAAAPSANAPEGMLVQVVQIQNSNGQVILTVVPVTLGQAITQASIQLNGSLTQGGVAQGFRLPGSGTSRSVGVLPIVRAIPPTAFVFALDNFALDDNGDTVLNGSLRMDGSFTLSIEIADSTIKSIRFRATIDQVQDLSVTSSVLSTGDLRKELDNAEFEFDPVTVFVGTVPVTVTPVMRFTAGVEGTIPTDYATRITQTSTISTGFDFENGTLTPIITGASSFNLQDVDFESFSSPTVFGGPSIALRIFGKDGPFVEVDNFYTLNGNVVATDANFQVEGGTRVRSGLEAGPLSSTAIPEQELENRSDVAEGTFSLDGGSQTPAPDGTVAGIVQNASDDTRLNGVTVVGVDIDDDQVASLTTANDASMGDGAYTVTLPEGSDYTFTYSQTGFFDTVFHFLGVVESAVSNPTILENVPMVSTSDAGQGSMSGIINNAVTGQPEPDVTCILRSGVNNPVGVPAENNVTTGANGAYQFTDVTAGVYTLQVRKDGFITDHRTVICLGNVDTPNQNKVISPILAEGETRIVLEWDEFPEDLDSHLTGPDGAGGTFHCFFGDRDIVIGNVTIVELDTDETTSFGPETITIKQQFGGTYKYHIHHFSGSGSISTTSQARVSVLRGSGVAAVFNAPSGQSGNIWRIFDMDGSTGALTLVNIFTNGNSQTTF
jgi:hypothetical protein